MRSDRTKPRGLLDSSLRGRCTFVKVVPCRLLVLIPVSVTDAGNHAVTGLDPRAFRIFDDKVEQTFIQLVREDAPLSVGNRIGPHGRARQ